MRPAAGGAGTDACFCLRAIAGKWCNGSGCGGCVCKGNGWRLVRAERLWSEEQTWTSKLALITLPENFSMMFDHPPVEPLGLYRKRSRVESAKRIWRVSGAFAGNRPAVRRSDPLGAFAAEPEAGTICRDGRT